MPVKLTRAEGGGMPLITGYGDGGFRVAVGGGKGQRHEGAILIINGTVTTVPAATIGDLAPDHLAAVSAAGRAIEILLIGSGKNLVMPSASVRAALDATTVAYDIMDSGAAARTYNVLVLEDRRVAALLIAVP